MWREWLTRNVASIGWPPRKPGEKPDPGYERGLQRTVSTIKKIRGGDRVVAYLKNGRIGGVGTFTGETQLEDRDYDPLFSEENEQGRTVGVRWDILPPTDHYCWAPEGVRLPTRGTIHRCSERDLRTLERAFSNEDLLGSFVDAAHLVSEGREQQELHPLIVSHLEALESGLQLWDSSRPTEFPADPIGKLDVFARDQEGRPVVIEAKTHIADDSAIGQVARYMAWVRINLVEQSVRGMLVAGEFPPKTRYAAAVIPSLGLHRYQVSNNEIRFHKVPVKNGD